MRPLQVSAAIACLTAAIPGETIAHPPGAAARSATVSAALVEPPRLLREAPPVYPPAALAAGEGGIVHLEIDLSATGTISAVRVVGTPREDLGAAALDAARALRFEPARSAGRPIPSRVRYHFRFEPPPPPPLPPQEMAARPPAPTAPVTATVAADPKRYQVLVSAQRAARSAADFSIDVGVERTALPAAASGAEILRRGPGVSITQHSGEGKAHQIFLRGFDAVHGQDVEITAGGIPINEVSNVHGQGYADLHFLIPEAVRRLRVLEGPFDPRQGDFAVAGSFDFGLGLSERGLLLRTSAGSFGTVRSLLAWGPEDQPDETFVAAELTRTDGFGPERAAGRASTIGQVVVPLGERLSVRLLASSYAARYASAGVLRLDDYLRGDVAFFDANGAGQGGSSDRHQLLIELTDRGVEHQAALSTYFVSRGFLIRQNFTGFLLYPEQGDRTEQTSRFSTIGGRAHYARASLFPGVRAEVGASFRHDSVAQSQQRLREVDLTPYLDEVLADLHMTDLGLWGELRVALTDRLSLRAGMRAEALAFVIDDHLAGLSERDRLNDVGVRRDQRRDAFGYHLAPRATLSLHAAHRLDLFASYGNGFRSPQALSLSQGEQSVFTVVHAGEVGLRYGEGAPVHATAALFVTYVEQDLLFDHATGRTIYSGETLRGGVTATVDAELWKSLKGSLAAAYTLSRSGATGGPVPFAPPLVVRAELEGSRTVARPWERELGLFGAIDVDVIGPKPLPFQEDSDVVALVSAAAGVSLGEVSLAVEVFNLFDAEWRDGEFNYASSFRPKEPSSRVPARHFTAGRPFTAQATLTLRI